MLNTNNTSDSQMLLHMLTWPVLLLLTFVFLLTYFLYTQVVRPYRLYSTYKRIIYPSYKTKVQPFNVFGTSNLRTQRNDVAQHGDSHHTIKFVYRDYQVVLSNFRGRLFVDLIDPELIRTFFERTMEGCYVKAVESVPFDKVCFSVRGDEWKMKRKIMSSVFNYDFIKNKVETISEICNEVLDEIEANEATGDKSQLKVDLSILLQKMFGNVVIRCFFGDVKLDLIEGQPLFEFTNNLLEISNQRAFSYWAYIFGTIFYKLNIRKIDRQFSEKAAIFKRYAQAVVEQQIEKAKKVKHVGDNKTFSGIFERLIVQKKLSESTNQKEKDCYTKHDLIDQFATFFMAGTDTTSNTTTVLLYTLVKHPEVMKKVRDQIDKVIGEDLKGITHEKMKNLTYLQQVWKEILRMYSPTAGIFMREAVKDHYIGDIPIRKGMIVQIKLKSNHHKEQFYQHPERFDPERWNHFDQTKTTPFAYFPFSSGQRNCIGQHLALIEAKIAIITILKRFKEIQPQKAQFRMYMRTLYGAQQMMTILKK